MKIKQVLAESFAYDYAEPYQIFEPEDFIAKIKEWAPIDFDDALMLATAGLEYEYPELHDQVCQILKPYALKYVLEIAKNQHIPRDWELDDYFHHYVDRILKELQPDWPELDHIVAVANKAFQHAKKTESVNESEESEELVAEFLGYIDQKNYSEAFNSLISAYDTDRDCLQSWWASFDDEKPAIMKGLLHVIKNESDIPVESIIADMYADLKWPELVTVQKAMMYNKQQKAVGEAYDPDADPVIGYVQTMYDDLVGGSTELTVLNLRDYIYDTGSAENLARAIQEIKPELVDLIQKNKHGMIKSMLEMVKKDYDYAGKALFPVFQVLQHLGIRWPESDRIADALSHGTQQESVTENAEQIPAAEILKYVKQIHPEGEFNIDHVITDHPFWTEADVPVSSLHIFDPEQDDIYDPYNRVQDTDLYHVDRLIPNIAAILQNKPLVIDDAGYILDGNHRALAAEKAGLKMVPVWQPVKGQQGMAESNVFTNARMNAIKAGKDTFVVRGKTYKVTGDTTDELEAVVSEAWSKKYKRSINCSHPKGFSQKAHCAGRKKHNESVAEDLTVTDAPRVPAIVQHMDKKLSDNLRSVFTFVIELNSEPRMSDLNFRRQVLAVFDKHKPEILRYMLHYIKHSDSDNVKWLTPGMIKMGIDWPELKTIDQALNAKRPDRQVSENNYRYSEVHKQQAESDARVISSFLEKIRKQIEADPKLSANDISRFWDVIHSIKLFSRYRLDILQPVLEHHKKTIVYVILYLMKHNEIYDTIDDIIDNLKYARINWPELKTLQQALAQGNKRESVTDNFTESEQTPLDSLFYNASRLLDKNISYVGNVIIALRNDDRINEPEFLAKTIELFGKYKPQIIKYILNLIAKADDHSYSHVQWLIPRMKKLGIKWPEFKIIQKGITYGKKKSVSEAQPSEENPIRDQLNAWMNQDQQYHDPTQSKSFQAKVWPYIQQNIKTILADKGTDGKGSYPAAPYAAWLLVQHMDAYPQNQGEFLQQLAQSGLDPTDGKGGEGKLQFLKDRYEVNKWILQNANNKEYFINNKPLPNPTVNVRNPAIFKDAGIIWTSRQQALEKAIEAGNKLLVAAVQATDAQTQPSYKSGVAEESVDEAASPDAVKRIEQLVQYK